MVKKLSSPKGGQGANIPSGKCVLVHVLVRCSVQQKGSSRELPGSVRWSDQSNLRPLKSRMSSVLVVCIDRTWQGPEAKSHYIDRRRRCELPDEKHVLLLVRLFATR